MSDIMQMEDHGKVRVLSFNRPDALNALNTELFQGVAKALRQTAEDDRISVAILTGNGRAFCAGQDLPDIQRQSSDEWRRNCMQPMMSALIDFPKPLIAAVNGVGVGFGLTVLGHVDMAFMSDTAKLKIPFAEIGVVAEACSTTLLPDLIGWANMADILYTAGWIDADRAVEMGLVWRKVAADDLMETALAKATEMARMPRPTLMDNKRIMLAARRDRVLAALDRENDELARLFNGPINREAVNAFKEKRAPDFDQF